MPRIAPTLVDSRLWGLLLAFLVLGCRTTQGTPATPRAPFRALGGVQLHEILSTDYGSIASTTVVFDASTIQGRRTSVHREANGDWRGEMGGMPIEVNAEAGLGFLAGAKLKFMSDSNGNVSLSGSDLARIKVAVSPSDIEARCGGLSLSFPRQASGRYGTANEIELHGQVGSHPLEFVLATLAVLCAGQEPPAGW